LGFKFKKEGNYYNELKLNKFTFTVQTPAGEKTISPGEYEIWDIAAGDNFSLVLLKVNLKCYLLKFGISTEDKYSNDVELINTVNIVDVDHEKIGQISNIYVFGQRSILLTTNNDLYVGGVDFDLNPINKYKHVERFGTKVRSVHLGQEHCLILDCKILFLL
jgi:alpha-tubulin suppressor-like RCC1 family protein